MGWAIAGAIVVIILVEIGANMVGTARREIEFRKAFKQRCLEDERDKDQR